MNKAEFYKELRKRNSGVFGTSLSQAQVDGVEAILAECQRQGCDRGQTAYILATAYGETGGKMQPRMENMNYSAKRIPQVFSAKRRRGVPVRELAGNPKLLANTVYAGILGNRVGTNDGWNYRGTGIPQVTGRDNFQKWGSKMKLPLLDNPQLLMDLDVSVRALVQPMMEGWATGKKLPEYVKGFNKDYVSARRVWNGTFEANKYAGYARAFEGALRAMAWPENGFEPSRQPQPTKPDQTPHTGRKTGLSWWIGLLGSLIAVLGRKSTKKGNDR